MTRKEKMRFYHSPAWKHKSQAILVRDHYECQECRKRIARAGGVLLPAAERRIAPATLVHHIVPIDVDRSLALDDDNLEAVCDRCHNLIHGRVGRICTDRKKKMATEEKW